MEVEAISITLTGEGELTNLNIILIRNDTSRSINLRSFDGGLTWSRNKLKVPFGTDSMMTIEYSFKGVLPRSDWNLVINEAENDTELLNITGKVGQTKPPFLTVGEDEFSLVV